MPRFRCKLPAPSTQSQLVENLLNFSFIFYFPDVSLSFITFYVSVLFIYCWRIFMCMLSFGNDLIQPFTWLYLLNRIVQKLLEGLWIHLPDFCCELFVTVPSRKIALLMGEMCCLFIISNKSHDLVIVFCVSISLWTRWKGKNQIVGYCFGSNHVYITFVMIHTCNLLKLWLVRYEP